MTSEACELFSSTAERAPGKRKRKTLSFLSVFLSTSLSFSISCGGIVVSENGDLCGNGIIDENEVCDGDNLGGESCISQGYEGGTLACRDDCSGFDFSGCFEGAEFCGNNIREGKEACDGTDLGDETCESRGFDGGDLACLPDCSGFNVSGCYMDSWATCGNNIREGDEICDGTDLDLQSCSSLGFEGGTLRCLPDCSDFDISGCQMDGGPVCGNNKREGEEICDGTDLDGQSCFSRGFDGGSLSCLPDCSGFNESSCYHDEGPVCGNNIREGDEICDGSDLGDQSCQTQGYDSGSLSCLPDCSGFDTSGCQHADPGTPAGTCGTQGPTNGLIQHNLDSQRYYKIAVPSSSEPLPMVMVFHGDGTSPTSEEPLNIVLSYWAPVYNNNGNFILVMMKCPQCATWHSDYNRSEQYIRDVLDDVASRYNVDVNRIYASGYSGGGSILSVRGLRFQSILAGIHFNCGGGYYGQPYVNPPRADCKVPARFTISQSDFLFNVVKNMETFLRNNGHEVQFNQVSCSGHCCNVGPAEAQQTLNWFLARTKCGGTVTGQCASITDLP